MPYSYINDVTIWWHGLKSCGGNQMGHGKWFAYIIKLWRTFPSVQLWNDSYQATSHTNKTWGCFPTDAAFTVMNSCNVICICCICFVICFGLCIFMCLSTGTIRYNQNMIYSAYMDRPNMIFERSVKCFLLPLMEAEVVYCIIIAVLSLPLWPC